MKTRLKVPMQCSVLLERLSSGVVHHERDDERDGVDVEAEGPDEEVSELDRLEY